jgi:hypothetical protein
VSTLYRWMCRAVCPSVSHSRAPACATARAQCRPDEDTGLNGVTSDNTFAQNAETQ